MKRTKVSNKKSAVQPAASDGLIPFTIRRSEWYRGRGGYSSRLYIPASGKYCCVGIWGRDICGFSDEELANKRVLNRVDRFADALEANGDTQYYMDSGFMDTIYSVNDEIDITETRREERLTELFAEIGYRPVFVD